VQNKDIIIDTTAPSVSNVTSSSANNTYSIGQVIPIQVVFSEPITVTGTPQITLSTGSPATTAVNCSGNGTATLTCNYTVVAGNFSADLSYSSTSALALNGGTIKDAAGNAATLTLASPGVAGSLSFNKDIVISTTIPAVVNVTSSTPNGSYKAGAIISIQVVFDNSATVTGAPQLQLQTNNGTRYASCSSGTGTTMNCSYTVVAGDTSADLDYISTNALGLNGGTINSTVSGQPASLTLSVSGASGSLGYNKDIIIDTTAPSAPTIPDMTAATDSGISNTDNITSNTTPDFVISCETGATVNLYDGVTLIGTGTCVAGTVTITSSTLSNGAHSINAKQTDPAGNTSIASGIFR